MQDYQTAGNYWKIRPIDDPKMDWHIEGQKDWIDGYVKSKDHPHRELIIDALKRLPKWNSLLEVGCNAGPNLALIKERFPDVFLGGIDPSEVALKKAIESVGEELFPFSVGEAASLPFPDKYFDVILCDAVLMYVPPEQIFDVMKEFTRVARVGMVFCEWYNSLTIAGKLENFHWARDYSGLFKLYKMNKIFKTKITEKIWPTKAWAEKGHVWSACLRQSPILDGVTLESMANVSGKYIF